MAIKTGQLGQAPAITYEYVQFSSITINTLEKEPFTISIVAKVRPYGIGEDGKTYYSPDLLSINLGNLQDFISKQEPQVQLNAMEGLKKVQEGLGVLAEMVLGIDFEGYEAL